MAKHSARQIRETIARAVETARPWLKFASVRASGSGSRVMFYDPRSRLLIYDYHKELSRGKRLDHYLTPEGKIEAWEYKPDGGGDGWIRKFVRVLPFSKVNLEKVMECIQTALEHDRADALEETERTKRRASAIKTALSQI